VEVDGSNADRSAVVLAYRSSSTCHG